MTLTHTTAVVIVPPAECWPPIQAIRQRYDRQARRWMPHITLLYPFYPREHWPAASVALASACAQTAPFDVNLAAFDRFRQPRQQYALWLATTPPEPLIALQTALWRAAPECDSTRRHAHGFTPHLSVGQARGEAQQAQRLAAMRADWQPLRFSVGSIQLIWRDEPPDDVFRIGQTMKLGEV
jgi:RNA 2',3'-cyclic 3'-phosphodiesterase